MKNHQMFKSVAVIAAILMAILTAGLMISCPEAESSKRTGAQLTNITIKDITPDKIPTAISKGEWNDDEFYFTDDIYTESIILNDVSQLTDVVVDAVISPGAKVDFGLASGYTRPEPEAFDSDNTLNIEKGQAIYVRVTAEDGKHINYYRFEIALKNAVSQLSTLTVAGMTAVLGNPGATVTGLKSGVLNLSNSLKTDATITGTPRSSLATVEYAFTGKTGRPGDFASATTHTFADGDFIYVKVTAENGVDISYYKIEVQIGRDATLKSVKVGDAEADKLGTPQTTWTGNWGNSTSTQRGTCQANERMPADGFEVEILANDSEAEVVWARTDPRGSASATTKYPEPDPYDGSSPFKFPPDTSDIIIKVTSSNGANTNWYQVRLITKSYGVIYKGTPIIKASSEKYIDPIWNQADKFTDENNGWLDVSRLNVNEPYNTWFGLEWGRHTTAKAKVLWDDDGLYVYWDVDFKDYKTTETGDTQIRTATLSGAASSYTPGTDVTVAGNSVPSDAHQYDSVEFFVNERWQAQKTGNYGNQYRSGLPNADGTIWLSGEKGNAPADFNPITAFQIAKKVSAWIKKDGDKEIGYVIIMGVPWVHYGTDDDLVFDAEKKVKPGAEVGLELQVNAATRTVSGNPRDGILTWNGVTSQAYQNVKSFGIVTLLTTKGAGE